jgi:bla regulator protein blaR1
MNGEAIRDLLTTLGLNSLHASVLVLLVLAIRAVLGDALAPRWRCALWLLVIVRLAWPFHLPSPVSIFNLVPTWDPKAAAAGGVNWSWLGGIWMAGAVAIFSRVWLGLAWNWWRVFWARPLDSWDAWWLWQECKDSAGIDFSVPILQSRQVSSPCLVGSLRPCLLVPAGLLENFTREEIRLIFLHELAHVRRGDLWLNWLLELVRAFHWFNPLIWVVCERLRADREEACDAAALEAQPGSNRTYGRILLRFLEMVGPAETRSADAGRVSFTGQDSPAPETLMHRCRAIASFRPETRTWIVGFCTWLALGLVGLTDAQPAGGMNSSGGAATTEAAPVQRRAKIRLASSSVSFEPMSYQMPGTLHVFTGVRG